MKKIKNIGKKIVHIGVDTLMPGDEIIASENAVEAPAIQVLAKHGILIISDDTTTADVPKTADATKPVADEAEAVTESGAKKPSKKASAPTK